MDATYITKKRQIISKEAIYIVFGTRLDGIKEALGFIITPTKATHA